MKILSLNKQVVLENVNRLMEIDKVIEGEENWGLDNFLMDVDKKWEYSFMATDEDDILGFIICSIKNGSLYVHRLAVASEHQAKRVGTILLNYVCELASKRNLKSVMLQVKKSNTGAIKFYERNGFKKVGVNGSNYVYKRVIK